ncbi:MAG: integrin alpha [Myxococcota bacterium]
MILCGISGCGDVFTPSVESPTAFSSTCHQVEDSSAVLPQADARLGAAVDIVRFGAGLFTGPKPFEDQQALVGGAPLPSGPGAVTLTRVSMSSGSLTGLPDVLTDAGITVGTTGDMIGATVVGVDILDAHDDSAVRTSHGLLAAGEEVLVGAPAGSPSIGPGGDGPGAIHLFYNAFDGVVGDDVLVADRYRWEYLGSFTPAGAPGNAEFGASFAVGEGGLYGSTADYVVVGAPGENAVYILQPDPAWSSGFGPSTASPFSGPGFSITRINGAAFGGFVGRFGASLVIDDFDEDGKPDLAIGAPRTSSVLGSTPLTNNGAVFIIPGTGTSTGATPFFDLTAAFRVDPVRGGGGSDNDILDGGLAGFSLASGRLRGTASPPVLVTGLPRMENTAGGVCEIHWPAGFGTPPAVDCERSPFWDVSFGPFPNVFGFGVSLGVGNLIRHDTFGDTNTPEATVEELAVAHFGVPATVVETTFPLADGTSIDDFGYVATTGAVRQGVVTVFRSEVGEGSRIHLYTLGSDQDLFVQQVTSASPQLGAGFGSALIVDDLGPPDAYPELILGTPGFDGAAGADTGRVSVTAAEAVAGFDDPLSGTYATTDSQGTARTARLIGTVDGYELIIPGFYIQIRENGGTSTPLCSKSGFDGDETVDVVSDPFSLTSGGSITTDVELKDADGNEVVTLPATITHNATAMELTIVFTEPRVGGLDPWPSKNCLPVSTGTTATFTLDSFVGAACN